MTAPAPRELDVRPLIAAQRQPLPVILAAVNALAPGQALRLIAPLQPVPLYKVMRDRGYSAAPRQRDDGAWEVLFEPAPE